MSDPPRAESGINSHCVEALGCEGNGGDGPGEGALLHRDSFAIESWIELYHTVKLAVIAAKIFNMYACVMYAGCAAREKIHSCQRQVDVAIQSAQRRA